MKNYDDGNIRHWLAFILLIILAMFALLVNILSPQNTVYVARGELFNNFFKEPFETVVFIFQNGVFYAYSTHDEKAVNVSRGYILDDIKKHGKTLKDVAIIVHNHQTPASFSKINNKTYHYFKDKGFNGFFSIYYPHSKKVRTKER